MRLSPRWVFVPCGAMSVSSKSKHGNRHVMRPKPSPMCIRPQQRSFVAAVRLLICLWHHISSNSSTAIGNSIWHQRDCTKVVCLLPEGQISMCVSSGCELVRCYDRCWSTIGFCCWPLTICSIYCSTARCNSFTWYQFHDLCQWHPNVNWLWSWW